MNNINKGSNSSTYLCYLFPENNNNYFICYFGFKSIIYSISLYKYFNNNLSLFLFFVLLYPGFTISYVTYKSFSTYLYDLPTIPYYSSLYIDLFINCIGSINWRQLRPKLMYMGIPQYRGIYAILKLKKYKYINSYPKLMINGTNSISYSAVAFCCRDTIFGAL